MYLLVTHSFPLSRKYEIGIAFHSRSPLSSYDQSAALRRAHRPYPCFVPRFLRAEIEAAVPVIQSTTTVRCKFDQQNDFISRHPEFEDFPLEERKELYNTRHVAVSLKLTGPNRQNQTGSGHCLLPILYHQQICICTKFVTLICTTNKIFCCFGKKQWRCQLNVKLVGSYERKKKNKYVA